MFLSATSLQQLLASMGDGVCMLDMEGALIHWNRSAELLSGYQGNELLGRPCPAVLLQGLLGMERTVELSRLSGLLLQRQESRVVQGTLPHKKGHLLAVETTAFPLYDPLGLQLGACLLFRQKQQGYNKEQVVQLAKMAYFDSVSGTFSRSYGEMKLGAALVEMQQTNVPAGMLLVQLHNLKDINDSFGHVAGDELIQAAADCMKNSFSEHGKVYRVGGDEFVVIITKDIPQFENLLRAFEQRVESWHGEFVESMTVSYGYVFSSERKWNSIFDISKASDERMYESKKQYYTRSGMDRSRQ